VRWFGKSKKSKPEPPGNQPTAGNITSSEAKSDKQPAAKDRVVRVFVSSTFRDMVEDRNELMTHAWPALRRLCRDRAVEFVEVDLRWGVTEEQAQRKEVARHCLAEVKRCRPYFVGLLGERYGLIPGADAYSRALLNEEPWLEQEVAKHSLTELEIIHGVLNDPDMARRAFFYIRDPKYAAARGADFRSDDAEDDKRQAALKERVRAVCKAKNIPLHEAYPNPSELATLVLGDLKPAIDAEYPTKDVPDAWTREERDHEAHARSRCTEFYVGRDEYFDRLDSYARDGADGCGLVVLGESGGGKSALLANWVARWRKANPKDFVFQHCIGSSPASASHLALMRRLMVAVIRWCGDEGRSGGRFSEEERIPATAEEIEKVFPDYLTRVATHAKRKGVRAVIVLDALNQLEDRDRGRILSWLPHRLPTDLRLVVSTLPGDTLEALKPRNWPSFMVEPLTKEERVQLIAGYLKHFAQGLAEAQAREIAGAEAAANPLYLKTLLDDLRATGAYDQLDSQIADYLKAHDIPALLGKILARYEQTYNRDRPRLVQDALSLLWAARRGLTEPELLEALKPDEQERLPTAFWSPLRYALADGLVDRDGVLAFAHDFLRKAVEKKYVPDAATARVLRLQLADLFADRPVDARQADELPWLLRQAEERNRLRTCLLAIDRFILMLRRDEEELRGYWVWLKEEETMGGPYLQSFERWAGQLGREDSNIAYVANQLSFFLIHAAIHKEAEPLMRRALAIDEKSYGPEHPEVATHLNNLASLLQATNRLAEAEPLMRRALAIDEKSYGPEHPNVACNLNNLAQLLEATNRRAEAEPLMRRVVTIVERSYGAEHPNVATALNNLASLYCATNHLAEAEPLMRRALAIDEKSYGPEHPNVACNLNNLAQVLKATNRLAEAEPLMRRALAIDEKSYGPEHPNVAIRLSSLAQLLQVTNRLAEAEPLMRRALAIDEKSYGSEHPKVAIRLNNLAQLLQATNRLAEAEPLIRRALAIDEKSYGPEHPKVATRLSNLAQLLQATNRLAEAEPLMRRALAIDEKSYGPEHPDVARVLNNLAQLLQATNRLAEAEPLMKRHLEIFLKFTQATGHLHPHLQAAFNNYAGLLRAMGRSAEEIRKSLTELASRYGVELSKTVGQTGAEPSPKLRAVVEKLARDPSRIKEVAAKLQREDPALLLELIQWIQSQQRE